jgi:3-phosphoinositide dependent protein kinase-1
MCMDLAHGGELRTLINSYRQENQDHHIDDTAMDNTVAQFYLSEIVEALCYLQSQNIIHRDLKPENILITANGHLKITDFGTASTGASVGDTATDEEMRNSFVGTAEYVSPEVLQNENTTRACDVWALGCILFNMLVGKTPFQTLSEYLTFQRILSHCDGTEPLEYPSSIAPAAQSLIASLLKPIPEERYGGGALGSGNEMEVVKDHVFFSGVSWSTLLLERPPYIPDPSKFPSTDKMQDGANDDWLFEGEATPIMMNSSYGSDSDLGRHLHVPKLGQISLFLGLSLLSVSLSLCLCLSLSLSLADDTSPKWKEFLGDHEEHVFTGLIWKRKGLFARHRLMVLTNKPRLFYLDPSTMTLKGEVPWDARHPLRCQPVSEYGFDIHSSLSGRTYHITDSDAGAQMWIDLIHAMVEKQTEEEQTKRSVEAV